MAVGGSVRAAGNQSQHHPSPQSPLPAATPRACRGRGPERTPGDDPSPARCPSSCRQLWGAHNRPKQGGQFLLGSPVSLSTAGGAVPGPGLPARPGPLRSHFGEKRLDLGAGRPLASRQWREGGSARASFFFFFFGKESIFFHPLLCPWQLSMTGAPSARPVLPPGWGGTGSPCRAASQSSTARATPARLCPGRRPLPTHPNGLRPAPGAPSGSPHPGPRLCLDSDQPAFPEPGAQAGDPAPRSYPSRPEPAPRPQHPTPTQPAACVPGAHHPGPPQLRARGPAAAPVGWGVAGSGPRTRRRRRASQHPALLFLRRSLGSLRPGQAELRRRVRARAPLPPEAPRSRARPPRPPRPRRDRRRRKALGRAPRRHPRRTARPPRTSAAFAAPGSALLAGLGRQPRASPRGDAPRHPGPGARALARSLGREARAAAPASQVPSAGSPGGPSPSWPSGQRPGPGGPRAASSQLRTHSGRPNGPGPGPGGRARGTHCSRRRAGRPGS